MKDFKKILALILALIMCLGMFVACGDDSETPVDGFTVTFMVEGKQYGDALTVQNGRRITEPAKPTFSDAGFVFTGWYTSDTFAEDTLWNFTTGIVTANLTLYAGYRQVFAHVSDVRKANEPCTSKIVWSQSAASAADKYEVVITDAAGVSTTLTGSVEFDSANYLVTFTPATIPQGGKYKISVKDTTQTSDAGVAENVLLGGAGTEANPYLIGDALDFAAVNRANVAENTYFELAASITIETSRVDQTGFVFNGVLNGNGRTITLANSNCGAIYKVGEKGYVHNVGVAGAVSTALYDSVGSIADFNAGKIEKINTTAKIESTAGLAGANGLENALNDTLPDGEGKRGIAGGVVGTNLAGGTVYNCKIVTNDSSTGTVKACIAGGTIVGLNYGTIELCTSNGCFGAWNSTESGGKSLSNYSFGGGIAGINAGKITKCFVEGSAKLLAQRYDDAAAGDAASGTNNSNFGGIAGYNMANASITECGFSGIRVHADENVGGIAGLNAGTVSDCYVEGEYRSTKILSYVGGRKNVGGVVGKLEATGSVKNCFVTANVFAFTEGSAYAVAEKADNCVYLNANPNTKSVDTNPAAVALIAPVGSNNVAVSVTAGSYDGQADVSFVLAESYLASINGNAKFSFNGTTVVLSCEGETEPEQSIDIIIVADGNESGATVGETGKEITAPSKSGFKFVGWAVKEGGEVVFDASAPISMYDLQDYKDAAGAIRLYAVYEERAASAEGTVLIAVWTKNGDWVSADELAAIKSGFEAALTAAGKNVSTLTITFEELTTDGNKVADLGALVNAGTYDIIVGCGNNVNSTGGVSIIAKADILTSIVAAGRKAALLTENELAKALYTYLTGEEYAPETTAPETTAPETTAPETTAPETTAPETTVPETTVPETTVPETTAPETTVPETTAPEAPAADTSVKISVWTKNGSWVTADELAAIKSGFEAHLAGKGYDVSKLNITWEETTTEDNKVAGLGALVNEGGFDIVVGCGNNINSTAGVSVIEKAKIPTSVVAADRMAARLTENSLALELYTYLTAA